MAARGVKIGIGTDGAASNNALDMFRETYLASVLQKYRENDAAAFGAEQALRAATSAASFGFCGAEGLKRGAYADMVMIDLGAPNMRPRNNVINNVVYAAGRQNVLMTVSGGRIVYENGVPDVGEDLNALYADCEDIAERIARETAG